MQPVAIRFRRERWVTPDGRTIVAPLPPGVDGHFGPQLRRFVLAQYHQGQVTVPRLVALLDAIGIAVSKRQVVRLLIDRQEHFRDEARDVLRAGLASARWVTVDDTGARHKARNGFCTQIGNDRFTWFGTTGSKSRLNFLELLRAGHGDYVINAEALAYMCSRSLAGPVIQWLAGHEDKHFADRAAWQAHLDRLGIAALTVTPDPVLIATEGSIRSHGLLPDTVIVSDDAGQFQLARHGLCRVGEGVAAPTPHRPGRAVFPHPVPQGRVWLAVANLWTILAGGSGWRFRISLRRVHRTTLWRSRRDNHFCHVLTT